MIVIPISAIPNQNFTIQLDNSTYNFSLFTIINSVAVNLVRDNTALLSGTRVVAGYPVIPYRYLEIGNFIFLTQNDDLPDYTQFGITQSLIYASASELVSIRAGA